MKDYGSTILIMISMIVNFQSIMTLDEKHLLFYLDADFTMLKTETGDTYPRRRRGHSTKLPQ